MRVKTPIFAMLWLTVSCFTGDSGFAASIEAFLVGQPIHIEEPSGIYDEFTLGFITQLDGSPSGIFTLRVNNVIVESCTINEENAAFQRTVSTGDELKHSIEGYEISADIDADSGGEEAELEVNPHEEEAPSGATPNFQSKAKCDKSHYR